MNPRIAKIAAIVGLFTLSLQSLAQDQHEIDSLINVLSEANADTTIMDVYLSLGNEYVFNLPDSALHYTDKAFELANSLQDTSAIAECFNYYGIVGTIQAKYLTGIENFQQAMEWYELDQDTVGAAVVVNNIGVVYGYLDNYEESIKHYKEAMALNFELGDSNGVALNIYNIAADYLELEDYDSVRHYAATLEGFQKNREFWPTTSLRGEIYLEENKLDSAEIAYADFYEKMSAEQDFHQALSAELGLAEVYAKRKDFAKAKAQLDKIEASSLEHEFNDFLMEIIELRSEMAVDQGDFDKAFHLQKNYLAIKDSLDSINNMNRISELNAKYNSEKQEKELAEMRATIVEREALKKAQDRVTIISAVCLVIILAMMIISLVRKKKTNRLLNNQNHEISYQRQKILSSINYAKKIQNSILTPEQEIRQYLPESFVYFKPKDIVSGDFYWFSGNDEKIIIATIDCTGHGVPGALMSVICVTQINKHVKSDAVQAPEHALQLINNGIVETLRQQVVNVNSYDGMDIAMCAYNKKTGELNYAGAYRPLIIVRNKKLMEYSPNRFSLGGEILPKSKYKGHTINLKPNDCVYMFTDGYPDQFGGPKGKKYMTKRFKQLLVEISELPFEKQREKLETNFREWRQDHEQVDDILVMGFKVSE